MVEKRVVVTHEVGLHARPAALFVQTANKYAAAINVQNLSTNSDCVDAKSIIMVLTLGVLQNHELLLRAEGPDAENAVQALYKLVLNNFGDAKK
ncbi:MAG: HPr family phosphocarrier protein [Anaerolineales bacterium]|jgi:phosphotransferase system HPr (HPr) family protein